MWSTSTLIDFEIYMETDVWRQTTKHNHAQFMMQSTDPLSTPLRFMSCNSQSSCNFFLTKKDRSRSSCQHSFINMHERIFILAMRAGATVMLEAMNIQIWKQTTITLHMRIFGTTTAVCCHTYWCVHASDRSRGVFHSQIRDEYPSFTSIISYRYPFRSRLTVN